MRTSVFFGSSAPFFTSKLRTSHPHWGQGTGLALSARRCTALHTPSAVIRAFLCSTRTRHSRVSGACSSADATCDASGSALSTMPQLALAEGQCGDAPDVDASTLSPHASGTSVQSPTGPDGIKDLLNAICCKLAVLDHMVQAQSDMADMLQEQSTALEVA